MSIARKPSKDGAPRKAATAAAGRGSAKRFGANPIAPRDRMARNDAMRLLAEANRILDETERLLRTP